MTGNVLYTAQNTRWRHQNAQTLPNAFRQAQKRMVDSEMFKSPMYKSWQVKSHVRKWGNSNNSDTWDCGEANPIEHLLVCCLLEEPCIMEDLTRATKWDICSQKKKNLWLWWTDTRSNNVQRRRHSMYTNHSTNVLATIWALWSGRGYASAHYQPIFVPSGVMGRGPRISNAIFSRGHPVWVETIGALGLPLMSFWTPYILHDLYQSLQTFSTPTRNIGTGHYEWLFLYPNVLYLHHEGPSKSPAFPSLALLLNKFRPFPRYSVFTSIPYLTLRLDYTGKDDAEFPLRSPHY